MGKDLVSFKSVEYVGCVPYPHLIANNRAFFINIVENTSQVSQVW